MKRRDKGGGVEQEENMCQKTFHKHHPLRVEDAACEPDNMIDADDVEKF